MKQEKRKKRGESKGIFNRTLQKKISDSFELASTFIARARGLMFRRGVERPLLFVFDGGRERRREACAIHSLFVFFPFSVIYLDSGRRVVDVRVAKPFVSVIIPDKDAAYLIEGRPELAEMVGQGDVLEFDARRGRCGKLCVGGMSTWARNMRKGS